MDYLFNYRSYAYTYFNHYVEGDDDYTKNCFVDTDSQVDELVGFVPIDMMMNLSRLTLKFSRLVISKCMFVHKKNDSKIILLKIWLKKCMTSRSPYFIVYDESDKTVYKWEGYSKLDSYNCRPEMSFDLDQAQMMYRSYVERKEISKTTNQLGYEFLYDETRSSTNNLVSLHFMILYIFIQQKFNYKI